MQLLAVALISAGVLAYEILLARLFAIVQWYHFAYMIISMALLGYGASGSFLALAQERLRVRPNAAFALFATAFGIAAIACFALAERLPFNALELIWDPRQLLYLLALYALLTVPFFCGATCVGLAFALFAQPVGRVYRADLLGAGLGALALLALLFLVLPQSALRIVGAIGPLAAAVVSLADQDRRACWRAAAFAGAALLVGLATPASWTALELSPYKSLSQALRVPDAAIAAVRSSPLGLLSAVERPRVPFRHVPGLSLNNTLEPAAQIGVFTDGEGPSPITAFAGDPAPLRYLDFTLGALPYHLLERPAVLILGAGGGADVLRALLEGAAAIDAVELDPNMVELVEATYAGFAGGLYERPEVSVHVAEARGFVAASRQRYNLIELPLLDSFAAASAGNVSLHESFVYTVEAFAEYLDHLAPGGYLAITRWLKLPPRDSLKLFLTALVALERQGVSEPGQRLALLRSWDATLLLVKNGPLGASDRERILGFAQARSFDLAYLPELRAEEANRYNVLDRPYFYEGATALIGAGRPGFLEQYKFSLAPATDARPYFFDFFKWQALPELWRVALSSGTGLLDWGYLILMATLVQAALLSVILILLPLWLGLRSRRAYASRWRVLVYFGAIGLAFLFVEIAAIQRFTLFLSHPLYAIGVVVAGFLVFAGLGSGYAARLGERFATALRAAVLAIGVLATLYALGLPPLFRALIGLPDGARIGLALLLIAPLAFVMGMPFPLALARLKQGEPDLVPWAWAVNGCASVLSAILATILAINLGTTAVVLLAVLLYLLAALVFAGPGAVRTPP
jgi:SAM-dependent methyltransferase